MTDKLNIHNHIDNQRWLLNNGFINDLHKDNLYIYGSILHAGIMALDLDIDINNKNLHYTIYCDKKLIKALNKFNKLKNKNSILSLLRLKFLLSKNGNLNFHGILSRFIRDYCGPNWSLKLDLESYSEYKQQFDSKSAQI